MKRSVFIVVLLVPMILAGCNETAISYETNEAELLKEFLPNIDTDSDLNMDYTIIEKNNIHNAEALDIIAAGCFNSGLCPVVLWNGSDYFKGFIDKEGNLKFYFEIETSIREFADFHNDDYPFLNAYYGDFTTYKQNDTFYVIDREGQITSQYLLSDVKCYGNGYTWIETETESSWNTEAEYIYTLYDPFGNEEYSINNGNEEKGISYLGEGVFYTYYSNEGFCYFTNKHSFLSDIHWASDNRYENGYIILDEENLGPWPYYFTYMDTQGNIERIDIEDDYYISSGDTKVIGITSDYAILSYSGMNSGLLRYNFENQSYEIYNGKYINHLSLGKYEMFNNGIVAFRINGADGHTYYGLVNGESFEDLGEPILRPSESQSYLLDDCFYTYDFLHNGIVKIYNHQGELLSEYDIHYYCDCLVNEGVVVYHTFNNDEFEENSDEILFLDYYGNRLFEGINYSDAVEVSLK